MKRSSLNAADIRGMSAQDVTAAVSERKKELMELRFKNAVGQLGNPHRVRELRREVAQLLTVSRQQAATSRPQADTSPQQEESNA